MNRRLVIGILVVLVCVASAGAQSRAWDILREIVLVPGVSGYEGPVSDFIQGRLPAGLKIERDAMNNVWFTVGSGKPHILFVAHVDELGWVVDKITPEGRVRVKAGGGIIPQTVEARPVLIRTSRGDVPGIVSPRPGYDEKPPQADTPEEAFTAERFEIYLGVATEAEAVRGKTITFAWDVQEETGLFGATELAKTLKPDYVFAIDTFVSTDSPLESKRFAYLPVGKGAVLRAIDSSNVTPRSQFLRVAAIARRRAIPVQIGNSRGGNDGSVFLAGGAVDIPLSWPGSYAHSLIEKIDRRDLEALTDLILAVASDWK